MFFSHAKKFTNSLHWNNSGVLPPEYIISPSFAYLSIPPGLTNVGREYNNEVEHCSVENVTDPLIKVNYSFRHSNSDDFVYLHWYLEQIKYHR